ncbi:MAG: hypothetical protein KUG79_07300 [Pseudomonadales bacterium]|nr:hypothetical protein [Pseudomonadales bacterium]
MRLLLPLLMLLLVAGCGFHLRGSQGFDLQIESVSISAANAYGEFYKDLERTFKGRGVAVVVPANAAYRINIISERTKRRAVSTSADISVAEYELRLETSFQITDAEGESIIAPTQLIAERIYSFNRTSFVGNTEEEKILKKEMRRDIAGQLLRRFSATLRNLDGPAAANSTDNSTSNAPLDETVDGVENGVINGAASGVAESAADDNK